MRIDVCNGGADGLCAVLQWRLHAPAQAMLVTGLKRDIAMLEQVRVRPGDEVLVCNLSLRKNHSALLRLLDAGARVSYFDHHPVDNIPTHHWLRAHLEASPDQCSSVLVDRYLGGRHRAWAVVGAFGDKRVAAGETLARSMGLASAEIDRLRLLGQAINYNAYGDNMQDMLMTPHALFAILLQYPRPQDFLGHPAARALQARRQEDLLEACALLPYFQDATHGVYLLPDAAWSRRAMGCLGNLLALQQPQRALALLRPRVGGDAVVCVRAPHDTTVHATSSDRREYTSSAAEFCGRFGGHGSADAACIDHLPTEQRYAFLDAFVSTDWLGSTAC